MSGPFEIKAIENDGAYGDGPMASHGYKSFAVVDAEGRTLVDTLNSDAAVINDYDYDEPTDEVGLKNIRIFAASDLLLAYAECEEALWGYTNSDTTFEEFIAVLVAHGFTGHADPLEGDDINFINDLRRRAIAKARGTTP